MSDGGVLRSLLTEEQWRSLKRNGYFTVIGGQSGVPYRIYDNSVVGNVRVGDRYRWLGLCCHAEDGGTLTTLVGQVLAIRHDEGRFLATAHKYGGDGLYELPVALQKVMRRHAPRRQWLLR